MSTPPNKLAVPLAPLLPRLELDEAGLATVAAMPSASAALEVLVAADRMPDAMRLIAHALPRREAVWWACMCARGVPALEPKPLDIEALTAAELWVRRPDEATRRAAMEIAEKGGFRSPEGWAAVGAFWSGGSIMPEGQAEVVAPDHLTGVAVASAIIMSALRHTPVRAGSRFTRFVTSARDIAAGGAGRIPPEDG